MMAKSEQDTFVDLLRCVIENDGHGDHAACCAQLIMHVGAGLMRGIELTMRHPEYAAALRLAFLVKNDEGTLIDDFVRQSPITRTATE